MTGVRIRNMSETLNLPWEGSGKQAEPLWPVIPTLGRLREEDYNEFEASLSYAGRHCLKTTGGVGGAGLTFEGGKIQWWWWCVLVSFAVVGASNQMQGDDKKLEVHANCPQL